MIGHFVRRGSTSGRLLSSRPKTSALPPNHHNNLTRSSTCLSSPSKSTSLLRSGNNVQVRFFGTEPIVPPNQKPQRPSPRPYVNPDFLNERMGSVNDYTAMITMDSDVKSIEETARDIEIGSGDQVLSQIQTLLLHYGFNFVWFTQDHVTRIIAAFKSVMQHGRPTRDVAMQTAFILATEMVAHGMHPDLQTFEFLLTESGLELSDANSTCILLMQTYLSLVGSERGLPAEATMALIWDLFDQLQQYGKVPIDVEVLVSLINSMAQCGSEPEMDRAIKEAKRLGFYPSNIDIINICLQGTIVLGNGHRGLKIFEESRKASVRPSLITFQCLQILCSQLEDAHRLWRYFDEFKHLGIRFDTSVFSVLLNTMIVLKSADGFSRAVKEFQASGLKPDSRTWAALISGNGMFNKKLDKALEVFDTMRKSNIQPDSEVLHALLLVCARYEDIDKAHRFYHELIGEKVVPTNKHFEVLLQLAVVMNNESKFEEAVQMLKESGLPYDRELQNLIKEGRITLSQQSSQA